MDDEPHARDKLCRYLAEDPRVAVVGQAGDGVSAVALVEELRPDLIFLDIQMPEMDGFDVLEALDLDPMPRIVFVTAHDAHAVQAFEVEALDYLLKPVDHGRFVEAVGRAVASIQGTGPDPHPLKVLDALPGERRRLERFLVRGRGRMQFVAVADVDWIGAAGNYVELHVGEATHLVRGTLQALEHRMPEATFARIHRSTIVNLDRVAELHPWSHGDLQVVLHDRTELRLSRRYRDRLEGMFGP
ncbi:MAG TPA: LytTR family DNA-binding domain-containing protein [Longimicrobiales bacterium]|nr:LytTR family DNA-binding domain-containing protein [Longimicrobiales bacterium]